MKLWLDDVRPAPEGWVHVLTADGAKQFLVTGDVEQASLDHDLGICDSCLDAWRAATHVMEMPNCEHYGTGYTLCVWMAETGYWPKQRPTVHSMNPVGRASMQGVIDRYYPGVAETV